MDLPQTTLLLRRVHNRLRLQSIGRSMLSSLIFLSLLFLTAVTVTRLTGLPGWNERYVLAAMPLAALLGGCLFHRRVSADTAARVVDQKAETDDLFLTASMLQGAAPEFKPLVLRDAEARATRLIADGEIATNIVPLGLSHKTSQALGIAVVAGLALLLPRLDPFGRVQAEQQNQQKKTALAQERKAVKERIEELKKEKLEGEHSEAVDEALKDLQTSLKEMKPKLKDANFKELAKQQKTVGKLWQKISAEQLKQMGEENKVGQQFGAADGEKLKKWSKELQEGSTEGLKKELEELAEDLEKLKKTTDPAEREKIAKEIKKRMQDISDFAADKLQSPSLSASIDKALQQLDMAKSDDLSEEATEALQDSMKLSKMELQQIQQSAKDMKELEEALKVMQMAKKLNDQEKLDGEACQKCQSLEEYEALYAQLIAERGEAEGDEDGEGEGEGKDGKGKGNKRGKGKGMGGPGQGEGGVAEENDSVKTDFKTEQSKSPVTKGKVLMTLKSKGVGEKGEASQEYKQLVREVEQEVSSAIESEQIPPGYQEGIRTYFDSIKKEADAKP